MVTSSLSNRAFTKIFEQTYVLSGGSLNTPFSVSTSYSYYLARISAVSTLGNRSGAILTFDSGQLSWQDTARVYMTVNGISLIKISNTSTISILHTNIGGMSILNFYTGSTICQGTLQAFGINDPSSITLQVYAI